ncbi:MAG: hypothetical protein HYX41_05975 [Bdellovibrio sp.]|nr:hypothetical protein [Bdellovibrio sp.]
MRHHGTDVGVPSVSGIPNFIQKSSVIAMLCAVLCSGCNILGVVDSPSGDAQTLSKARACFDQADYTCAAKYYALMSSVSQDTTISESVFQTLAQNGATMGVFMSAATSASSGGRLITKIASSMSANGTSGQTRRLAIFHAYQQWSSISDTNLRNLVRFLSSLALVAEILSEDAGTAGTFSQSDWVTSPTQCAANTNLLLTRTGCTAPSGKNITTGAKVTLSSTTTDSSMSGSPTLGMIAGGISEIDAGLTGMSIAGGVGGTAQGFTSQAILNAVDPTNDGLYRGLLFTYDIGAQ